MLRCVNNGVMTIKPGHQTTRQLEMHDMVRRIILHAVPYIRKSLLLESTQGSLQSRMPGSVPTVKHGEGSVKV
jgi:hypothetical protein